MRIYVDGQLEGTANCDASDQTNSADLLIGKHALRDDQNFPGIIDEVRLYDYALSEGEIADLCGGPIYADINGSVNSDLDGLNGVPVSLVDSNNDLYESTTTDEFGYYQFAEVPNGDYTVEIQVPLGYTPISDPVLPVTLAGMDQEVNFSLEQNPNTGCVRQAWFWNWQVKCALRGWGWAEHSEAELTNWLDKMSPHFDPHFYSAVFPDVYGLEEMNQILSARFYSPIPVQAKKHFFATLLNVVSGKLNTFQVVSHDGATASQAITYMANLLTDTDSSNDSDVILIAMNINCAWFDLPSGIIPPDIPHIAFKDGNGQILPNIFELGQNYPNPFNPTTEISYCLPDAGLVSIDVYNIVGQKVITLVNEYKDAGTYTVTWDGTDSYGSNVASGIYLYRIIAGDYTKTKKMSLQK
jgi:hypothetical protein